MFLGLTIDVLGTGTTPVEPPSPPPPPPPPPATVHPGARPFVSEGIWSSNSIWRKPLAPDAPTHPDSVRWSKNVCEQFDLVWETPAANPRADQRPGAVAGNAWFGTNGCGAPTYVVDAGAPTEQVYLTAPDAWYGADILRASWMKVPMPLDVAIGNCMDKTVIIWQPATDTLYEMWATEPAPAATGCRLQAGWGGTCYRASESIGFYANRQDPATGKWTEVTALGHTASSGSVAGGVIQPEELDRGYIGHALHLVVGSAAFNTWAWPAQRTDGDGKWWKRTDGTWGTARTGATYLPYPDLPPEGLHLRFPADTDLTPYTDPLTRMMVEAVRDYGIVITDITHGGNQVRFRESTTYTKAGYPNPWSSRISRAPDAYLWEMPWHRLRVVDHRAH